MNGSRESAGGSAQPSPAGGRGWFKLAGIAALVATLVVAGRLLPVGGWLNAFNAWVAGLGVWGFILFVGAYVVAAVLFLPGSVLTLGAGFAFGVVKGAAAVSLGATLGAAAAFLISRYFARAAIGRKFGASPRFQAVDRAIGQQGAKIVFLLRLSPVFPFNALNYLLGLTSVRFWHYVVASWLGMLPGTFLYVYLGHAGRAGLEAATAGSQGSWLKMVYLGAGLAATVAVTIYVTRLAKRELQHVDETEKRP